MLRLQGVTGAMRFRAPDTDTGYSHALEDDTGESGEKLPLYLYMCVLSDLGVVREAPYYGVSRRLDLDEENGEGDGVKKEEREEDKKMVFDIVDAKFAVYEKLVGRGMIPVVEKKTKSVLICVSITPSSPSSTHTDTDAAFVSQSLHDSLLDTVKKAVPPALTTHSCMYRWAGEAAQPDMHPLIDIGVSGEWMVTVLVVDEEGETLMREHSFLYEWSNQHFFIALLSGNRLYVTLTLGFLSRIVLVKFSVDSSKLLAVV
ncbi:hypothetical protein PtrCC142_008608 [Pyrenophora tritici-repentis]|nr:hypothetical protein PtrSN001C_008518 [Pyrenophora tritici-repentis]KAI1597868.1 hypothetical protein PtrCC142_008608 [Pyrenophora tritici-repentis]